MREEPWGSHQEAARALKCSTSDALTEEYDGCDDEGDVLLGVPEVSEAVEDVEVEAVVVVAGSKLRSDCSNSTEIGCAHMYTGPSTTVVFKSLLPDRPGTVVVPSNELTQPRNMAEVSPLSMVEKVEK